MLARVQAGLVRVETWIAGFALVLLVGLTLLQIVARNVFETGFPALESLARVLLLYVTFLGAAIAIAADHHIKVDVVAHWLSGRWRARLHRPLHAIGALTSALLCWAAARYWYDEWTFASATERWLALAELILPVGFGLLALHFVLCVLQGPAGRRPIL
jgi:TRAP-type C4-dicarboxylate transport system permease small subunit